MLDQPRGHPVGRPGSAAALAAILLARFDITLLDEPTNDLDFDGLSRLEEMVARRRGAMVIVSHDRAFLERTVTDVLELDEHTRAAAIYGGGWAGFQAERAADHAHAAEAYARVPVATGRAAAGGPSGSASGRRRVSPGRSSSPATTTRPNATSGSNAPRTWPHGRAAPSGHSTRSKWSRSPGRAGIFASPSARRARSGDVVVRLEDAVVERGEFTLGPAHLGDRLGRPHRRWSGPTGRARPRSSTPCSAASPSPRGNGAWAQRRGGRARPRTAASWGRAAAWSTSFMAATGLPPRQARSQLAKFGLGRRRCAARRRLALAGRAHPGRAGRLRRTGVNFLVLDEPTNHLDLPAIEQLESALDGYAGTLLLVSHDRRLLESVTLSRRFALPDHADPDRDLREVPSRA